MQVLLQRRAEVALRSLDKIEQSRILRAMHTISETDQKAIQRLPHVKKLQWQGFYVYRSSAKMRLIISFDGDVCVVEDIVSHDSLERFLGAHK
jgi:mRNA-degrading endonuclease RelE of RelBE toxin-antitoxin system